MGRNKGLLGIKVYTLRMRQLLFGGGEFSGSIEVMGYGRGCPGTSTSGMYIIDVGIIMKLEVEAGYYKCSKCGYEDIPKDYSKVFFAPHMGRTRYMKCDECGEKSWHKKVVSKD